HRRILLAILLAVAVTAAALGIPLGFTAWELVSSLAKEDLATRAQRIAKSLDTTIAAGEVIDTRQVRLAIPDDGYLLVRGQDGREYRHGTKPRGDVLTETANIGGGGQVQRTNPLNPALNETAEV